MSNRRFDILPRTLPESWEPVPLGEIAASQRGITYDSRSLSGPDDGHPYFNLKSFLKGGGYNPEGLKHFAGVFRAEAVVTADDLLIANTDLTPGGDVIGAPALVPEEYRGIVALASHHVNILRLTPRVDKRYLYYLLCSPPYRNAMRNISAGTTVLNLDKSFLMRLPIPLPALPEQCRIAEILDAADEAIRQTERLIAKLKAIKAGLLHDLLTHGLDEHGHLRDPQAHPEQFKDSLLGRIPREWEIHTLADVAEVNRGKFAHRPRNEPRFYGGEYPFIQTGDVTESGGRILCTYLQTLNEKGAAISREFPAKTIAVTIAANIADTAILEIPMFFPDSIVGAVVRPPNNVRYVELCIRRAKSLLDARAPQSAQKNINLRDLRWLVLGVPTPEEQNRIAEVYETHDARIRAEEAALEKLRQVKRGLMNDLLTGKVRVASE